MISDRTKFNYLVFVEGLALFFLEALFAKMLWNGVGRTLLHLPPITFWQMCGLTLLASFILPYPRRLTALMEYVAFNKNGNQRP